jgi:TPR repeat protein
VAIDAPLSREAEVAEFINENYAAAVASGEATENRLGSIFEEAAERFDVTPETAEKIFREQQPHDPVAKDTADSGGSIAATLQKEMRLAEEGDAQAQFKLALRYQQGDGVPQDLAMAAQWFVRAAEQYHAGAQDQLAIAYQYGLGVSKDLVTGYMWSLIANYMEPDSLAFELTRQSIASEMISMEIQEATQRASEWLSSFPAGP